MSKLICWIDTETTGLDPRKHAMVQLGMIVDDGTGRALGELDLRVRPFKGDMVTREALEKTRLTMDDLRSDRFLPPMEALERLVGFMDGFVNRYDREDKFVIGGKNCKFDTGFLRAFFDKCGDGYYGSWFHYPAIDVEHEFATLMVHEGVVLPNYRLETLCEVFGIGLDPHDAMEDVRATKELYYRLTGND